MAACANPKAGRPPADSPTPSKPPRCDLKQQGVLEKRFPGTRISWLEFPAGPQLLEALSVGSLEFGLTGDSPPVFAQAAGKDLLYVGAEPPKPDSSALLVLNDSPLRTLGDLKGRRIAVQKGSSAHYLLVRAVERAGLQWADIQPVYLTPADARAAFERKSVDAWAIWDPFYAATELAIQPRVLATGRDLASSNNSFYLAARPFVQAHPQVLRVLFEELSRADRLAQEARKDAIKLIADFSGLDAGVVSLFIQRRPSSPVGLLSNATVADSAADDTFADIIGTLAGSDRDGDAVSFALADSSASTESGFSEQKASAYGTFHLNTTTGAYKFVVNDGAVEALKAPATATFSVNATDGTAASASHSAMRRRGTGWAGGTACSGMTSAAFHRARAASAISAAARALLRRRGIARSGRRKSRRRGAGFRSNIGHHTRIGQRIGLGRNWLGLGRRGSLGNGEVVIHVGLPADNAGKADQQHHRPDPEHPDLQALHRFGAGLAGSGNILRLGAFLRLCGEYSPARAEQAALVHPPQPFEQRRAAHAPTASAEALLRASQSNTGRPLAVSQSAL